MAMYSKRKVLVIGAAGINEDELKKVAKINNFDPKDFDFVLDYKKISRFDFAKLKKSNKYSGIICGPCPHNCKGIDGYSSAIAMMEGECSCFSCIIRSIANNQLKITKTSFLNALMQLA